MCETKKCSKCGEMKPLDEFHKNKNHKDGRHVVCKLCKKEYNLLNKDKIVVVNKIWRDNNKNYIKEYNTIWNQNNKDYVRNYNKKYSNDNFEKLKINHKVYRKLNKQERNTYQNAYRKNRRNLDPLFRIRNYVANRIAFSLKNKNFTKSIQTEEILGCPFEFFKQYIESQFQSWMNWDNQGLYNGELNYGWDLDHIIPISSATTGEEMIKLNHYTNFQPLCSKINRDIKKDKLEYQ